MQNKKPDYVELLLLFDVASCAVNHLNVKRIV
jgi:hypothetical protein